ncbi:MAG: hypothetical protein U0361_04960 [Nitrospiraceae bacterium]
MSKRLQGKIAVVTGAGSELGVPLPAVLRMKGISGGGGQAVL